MKKYILISAAALALVALGACISTKEVQAFVVESYLQALADKDFDRMAAASCSAWENQARFELDVFAGVETRLEGLSCMVTGESGNGILVSCTGEIVAAYGAENRNFPLTDRTYRLENQGGEWLVCGTE